MRLDKQTKITEPEGIVIENIQKEIHREKRQKNKKKKVIYGKF